MVTLRQLRYFVAVARHLHFGRAAEECSVSQPALSVQIRELEATLGAPLLERGKGGVALTELGAEIDRRARAILSDARDLVDYARHSHDVLTGMLRLGVIPSIAPYVLPDLLPRLAAGYPDLDLEIREAQTRSLVDAVDEGTLDVALLSLPVEAPRIESLPLFDDVFLLLTPAARPEAALPRRPSEISPDDLLLLEDGHCMRDQTLTLCRTPDSALLRRYGATSLATIVQMVANGYGSTLLPEMSVPVELRGSPEVRITRFANPEPARTIGLAWRSTSSRRRDFEALGALLASRTAGAGLPAVTVSDPG
jgi:LysR family hydrogen peroxide-inducible transcriptional activator